MTQPGFILDMGNENGHTHVVAIQAEEDKSKRAMLQDTLVVIILSEPRLCEFESLDKAMFEVLGDQKYDSLWRSRFPNRFAKLVLLRMWPSKNKRKQRQPKNV